MGWKPCRAVASDALLSPVEHANAQCNKFPDGQGEKNRAHSVFIGGNEALASKRPFRWIKAGN